MLDLAKQVRPGFTLLMRTNVLGRLVQQIAEGRL
jgi:hypothetical protein